MILVDRFVLPIRKLACFDVIMDLILTFFRMTASGGRSSIRKYENIRFVSTDLLLSQFNNMFACPNHRKWRRSNIFFNDDCLLMSNR